MQRTRKEINEAIKFIFKAYRGKEEDTERAKIVGDDDEGGLRRDLPFQFGLWLVVIGGAALVVVFI